MTHQIPLHLAFCTPGQNQEIEQGIVQKCQRKTHDKKSKNDKWNVRRKYRRIDRLIYRRKDRVIYSLMNSGNERNGYHAT